MVRHQLRPGLALAQGSPSLPSQRLHLSPDRFATHGKPRPMKLCDNINSLYLLAPSARPQHYANILSPLFISCPQETQLADHYDAYIL